RLQVSDGGGGWLTLPGNPFSTANTWTGDQELAASAILDGLSYAPQTPSPALPGAGKVKLIGEKDANRVNPAFLRSEGRLQWIQGMVGWNGSCAILPGTSGTPSVWGTALGASVGTITHPSPGSTDLVTSSRLINGVTAGSGANTQVTIFENQQHLWR